MTAPRLDINLDKIHHNASVLVKRLAERDIKVTGVTKATLGSPEVANAMLRAGINGLGDSRIENIETMRAARVPASMTLIRSPMLSQANRVVRHADVSFNTELDVISKLSSEAKKERRTHGVVLMVELGDLREGIMPDDLEHTVREVLRFPNITLKGIGTNLACRSGAAPDARNMSELSALADSIEATFGLTLDIVSGGNSANLEWALNSTDVGRINDLRLGESILLGREPLHRQQIEGLYTDAITLTAEVIESKVKPSLPTGEIGQTAFGDIPPVTDRGQISQTILALGRQDSDPSGLEAPPGHTILAASSDHLIVEPGLAVGSEITLQLNYSALVRAMTSPFVSKIVNRESDRIPVSAQ
ncbi:MAG: alanine/ornithine racemase family PLP-dependent enzyme [Planctomycetes bacterium]|nr:alanine/ornithine racemase family PLP-dependent enzyme [Planctomycetota bacterium]MCH9724933.1 alanine/ornithine racemase family PLP-dependent enzyme [Planctomycetota bacterium]MCH9776892.1 alanine/ornithine racemase family PLP-dependent enzyme [Planctomycetota bacterium]MCH9790959.1 alanine/ornithine racemase family PLP-dependent enzyme [Planctomycetota bacterium]